MSLLWSGFFYCVFLIPLMILAYIWGLHRRSRYAARMSSLSLMRGIVPNQSQWRRHLSFSFFTIALTSLIVALCRPVIRINRPSNQGIIILTLDVSKSMCSTDIHPTRIQALEATVSRFISTQGATTRIGIVVFSDFAELIQPPTNDKAALYRVITSLMAGGRRGIGDGIYESLAVIEREENSNFSANLTSTPIHPSGYAPAIIILVTSGINNVGPSPLEAASLAAERGVRIYTVGLSSPSGPFDTSCQSSDPSYFGEGLQLGIAGQSGLDVDALKQIATLTGAKYFPASGLSGLKNVFQDAQLQTILVTENVEITVTFVVLGITLMMISFFMALSWSVLL